jgi:hypothetical protein
MIYLKKKKDNYMTTLNYKNMLNYYLEEQIQELQNKIILSEERKINVKFFNTELNEHNYKSALDNALIHVLYF